MSNTNDPTAQPAAAQAEGLPPPASQAELQNQYIAIWKTVVETQMHFNEMSVKSRQLGLAFVAAALGISVVLLSRNEDFSFNVFDKGSIHVSVVLLIAAAFALLAVRQLDLGVYHKMLRGAVAFGEDFEEHYMKQVFNLEKGMTQAVSWFSRHEEAKLNKTHRPYRYEGSDEKTAELKISSFYTRSIVFLLVTALLLFVVHDSKSWISSEETSKQPVAESNEVIANDIASETGKILGPATE